MTNFRGNQEGTSSIWWNVVSAGIIFSVKKTIQFFSCKYRNCNIKKHLVISWFFFIAGPTIICKRKKKTKIYKTWYTDSKISLNGSIKTTGPLKNRPRIPTPDASNSVEKENRFNLAPTASIDIFSTSGVASLSANTTTTTPVGLTTGLTLVPANLSSQLSHQNGTPVTLLLSPINESDSNSAHSTLQAGTPATNALANAVLPDWRTSKHQESSFGLFKSQSMCKVFVFFVNFSNNK